MPNLKASYIKIPGLIFLALGTFLISLAFFLPRLIDINAYRSEIIATMQESLHRQVSFSRGEFSMQVGPSFTFHDVTVKEPDGSSTFLSARRIVVSLGLLPLLEKKVVMRDLLLEEADIRLERDEEGTLNIDDLLRPQPDQGYQIHLHKVQLRKGRLQWRDLAVQEHGLSAVADNIALTVENLARGHKGSIKLSFDMPSASGVRSRLSLSGTARLPGENLPLSETQLNASLDLKQAEPNRFWPYFGRYIPFPATGGRVDLTSTFKGKLREFSAKGNLRLAGVTVTWPRVFHHPVNPRVAQLDYDLKLNRNSIQMPSLHFTADGFSIKGSCQLQDITSNDLRITAKATSDPFVLEGLRQWIPYGIIADDASKYIEEHITGGTFKLDTGLLDGRVSQIVHMERGTNYNVLHIKGTVEKGIVSYGPKVPAFANIKAGLEMLGKDFIISHATGSFGDSPFRMEGRITDYPLDTPCQYPFQMEMTPRPGEVAWLARLVRAQKLEFGGGNSVLHLKGSGLTSAYQLSGNWDLKQAAYSFPGTVRKQVGLANTLSFSTLLGPSESRLTSLTYTLSPLVLSATAQFAYGDTPHLKFELQTNPFLMGDSLPILTQWQSHHPRGKVQAHIIGNGNPSDFASMDYSGSIALDNFALQPAPHLKTVSNITGAATFRGNSLETSRINVRYGSSAVSLQGRIRNFKHPEAELNLSSPEFFLRDAPLATPPRTDLSIRGLQLSLGVRDDLYTVRNLSGALKASPFAISGTYAGGSEPEADFSVTSSHLALEDLLLLGRLIGSDGTPQRGGHGADVKLKLAVEAGTYQKLEFTKLAATLSREGGILYLQGLEAGMYGGRLTAKGRIGDDQAKGQRYDLNFSLSRMNAERLTQALGITREVTGTLHLQGDITARGATFAEVKKTALGNLRLRLEHGSLRKFSVLSKLFSILNFSQLLKFQLPDMVSGGMPYNDIKGSFSVKDGTISTQDLFIRGDAINISMVGSADVVKEELNFTIGVQPLQTVDKIVNRIPVVGWLLTGKDKAFLTAYFEAKGKLSDPQVKAIPVKSLSKGVQNVFRRVFELPVRLFTDTGEVLLGK